jgi:Family of unknown function (DUF6776)
MRWKLLRRRLSVSAPRMIVRSHLPWPLRWATAAVVFGFSAAIALWAFEFGRDIAGLERGTELELAKLRAEVEQLRHDRDQSRRVSDTAASLLKTEQAAREALTRQFRQLEAENQSLRTDLGFFQRLLPSSGDGLQLRGLQVEAKGPGHWRYQMLVVQNGKPADDFDGQYQLQFGGVLDGKPWSETLPDGPRPLRVHRYARVDAIIDLPPAVVIKTVQARVLDAKGVTRAMQTLKL